MIRTRIVLAALAAGLLGGCLQPAQAEAVVSAPEAAIHRAFALAFQRKPAPGELRGALPLVSGQGLFALCRMLMNANEFVYLD